MNIVLKFTISEKSSQTALTSVHYDAIIIEKLNRGTTYESLS